MRKPLRIDEEIEKGYVCTNIPQRRAGSQARSYRPVLPTLGRQKQRIRKEFRVSSAAESIRSQLGLHVSGVVGKKNSVTKDGRLHMLTEGAHSDEIAWAADCSSVWENHLCVYNYKYTVSLRAVHTDKFFVCFCWSEKPET